MTSDDLIERGEFLSQDRMEAVHVLVAQEQRRAFGMACDARLRICSATLTPPSVVYVVALQERTAAMYALVRRAMGVE